MSEEALDSALVPLLEELDEKISEIDNHKAMRVAQKLIARRNRLMQARRALLGGGNALTGGTGNRVTRTEVKQWMIQNCDGPATVEEVAAGMGHTPEVIRGHFNRGKGEMFTKDGDNKWSVRDPEED